MFVDASAIVAVIAREAGYEAVADRLRIERNGLTSGMAIVEAVMALARSLTRPVEDADRLVQEFIAASNLTLVPIGAPETAAAIAAFARYGKGRGHPARLNLGDCFAYACARVHGVPLLFVGDDFPRTDIRSALP